jgi:biotin synthase
MPSDTESALRPKLQHNWTKSQAEALFQLPFNDLIFQAQAHHRRYFDANQVQLSRLLSVKTGGCPEDCAYCPQSAHHETGVKAEKLMAVEDVLDQAQQAREGGATRYCMGAAWRNPKDSDLDDICAMVEGVKDLGLESCATLGMLTRTQAERLKQAGLDYYNHNLDTSEEFYGRIITTRTYRDRLETLGNVRLAGIKVCSGGIVGMGESRRDRAGMLMALANLDPHPESVPINLLVRVEGTPLGDAEDLDAIEFVRTVAAAKIMMPASVIRLSAGREKMTDEMQALCFLAGAGSIFTGDKLLTTGNPAGNEDALLFERLGLNPAPSEGIAGDPS